MQKRNYYRAGWLQFRDDADMPIVLSELSDKKVCLPLHALNPPILPILQIEGFKLHVTHNQRAFVNRVRYAPEVASKPERIRKDLATAKELAGVLEHQAAALRQFKVSSAAVVNGDEE
ncbi:hypothetical protein C0991_000699, partial [Blastosporella zonata]